MRVWKLVSAVSASALAVLAFAPMNAAAGVSGGSGQSLCIGHHPGPDVWYNASCTGHDEPEIDPLSNHAGSARDLTWKGMAELIVAAAAEAKGKNVKASRSRLKSLTSASLISANRHGGRLICLIF